jgi:HAD superfamily hydrolase (TIGR01509 family)
VMPKAVLWDLDGTLVDSIEYHWLAWRDTMAAEGVAITYDQFLDSFGQRNDRIIRSWLGQDVTDDFIRRIGDAKEAEYRRLALERGVAPLPGAVEWLARLRRDGWRQAIASSAPRLNVEAMLNALNVESLIDAIASAEDVTAGKPNPQIFLAAASRLDIPAARCIVVEDVAAGVEAARRAGMRCIGVNRDAALDSDVTVRSLEDLAEDAFEKLLA